MIVAKIACLAHAERVGESLLVLAFGGLDVAAEPTVAISAKVLRVVLSVRMLTFSDSHWLLFLGRGWRFRARSLVLCGGSGIRCFGSGTRLDRCVRFGGGQLAVDGELISLPFQPI